MIGWLERYGRGQHRRVWTEMTSLGSDVRDDQTALAEARAVVQETMRRARHNVEQLVERLPIYGFQFEGDALVNPPRDVATQVDALEDEVGVLPLALRAWLEDVGEVNLNGVHPEWGFEYPDPLVAAAPLEYVRSEYECWSADRGTEWEAGSTFELPLAPDYLHKANVSGGAPYAIAVPNPAADALLLWEAHQTTFVNYLRIAFAMGGMPGWSPALLEGCAPPQEAPPAWLLELGRTLLPL